MTFSGKKPEVTSKGLVKLISILCGINLNNSVCFE